MLTQPETFHDFRFMRPEVVTALDLLSRARPTQNIVRFDAGGVHIDWTDEGRCHKSLLFPILSVTTLLAPQLAAMRWAGMGLAAACDLAPEHDERQQELILALAGVPAAAAPRLSDPNSGQFAAELLTWIERHQLEGMAVRIRQPELDRASARDRHYAVRPVFESFDRLPQLAEVWPEGALAPALTVLSLYNGYATKSALKGSPHDVRAVEALLEFRRTGVIDHFFRLVALYPGW